MEREKEKEIERWLCKPLHVYMRKCNHVDEFHHFKDELHQLRSYYPPGEGLALVSLRTQSQVNHEEIFNPTHTDPRTQGYVL